MKDDSFDCTLIAHLCIFLLFYRLLYCLILPENRLFFGIWKVVEIGFASGIYFSKFHQSILEFAEKNLPDDKKIFLICTYGGSANYKTIEQILDKRHASVVGNHVKY